MYFEKLLWFWVGLLNAVFIQQSVSHQFQALDRLCPQKYGHQMNHHGRSSASIDAPSIDRYYNLPSRDYTDIAEFPFYASILIGPPGEEIGRCGASIIDQKAVITSPKCFEALYNKSDECRVVAGVTSLLEHDAIRDRSAQVVKCYASSKAHWTDVAESVIKIVHLKDALKFSTYVKPVCLWSDKSTDLVHKCDGGNLTKLSESYGMGCVFSKRSPQQLSDPSYLQPVLVGFGGKNSRSRENVSYIIGISTRKCANCTTSGQLYICIQGTLHECSSEDNFVLLSNGVKKNFIKKRLVYQNVGKIFKVLIGQRGTNDLWTPNYVEIWQPSTPFLNPYDRDQKDAVATMKELVVNAAREHSAKPVPINGEYLRYVFTGWKNRERLGPSIMQLRESFPDAAYSNENDRRLVFSRKVIQSSRLYQLGGGNFSVAENPQQSSGVLYRPATWRYSNAAALMPWECPFESGSPWVIVKDGTWYQIALTYSILNNKGNSSHCDKEMFSRSTLDQPFVINYLKKYKFF